MTHVSLPPECGQGALVLPTHRRVRIDRAEDELSLARHKWPIFIHIFFLTSLDRLRLGRSESAITQMMKYCMPSTSLSVSTTGSCLSGSLAWPKRAPKSFGRSSPKSSHKWYLWGRCSANGTWWSRQSVSLFFSCYVELRESNYSVCT
jgi:hypothetical protein